MASVNHTNFYSICAHCQKASGPLQFPRILCRSCAEHLPLLEKFWYHVDKNTACECHNWNERCWPWQGWCRKDGYGIITRNHTNMRVHKFIYEAEHGPVPKGICILHIIPCSLRNCVRHLYAGTPKDNARDIVAMGHTTKGTNATSFQHGEKHPASYMTAPEVLAIRQAYKDGMSRKQIQEEFSRTASVVNHIVTGRRWKHLL